MGQELAEAINYSRFFQINYMIQIIEKYNIPYKNEMIAKGIVGIVFPQHNDSDQKIKLTQEEKEKYFNGQLLNIIYLCENNEKFLFPQIIFHLVEALIYEMKEYKKCLIKSHESQKLENLKKILNECEEKCHKHLQSEIKTTEDMKKKIELVFNKSPKEIPNIYKLYFKIFEFCFSILKSCLAKRKDLTKELNEFYETEKKKKFVPVIEENENILKMIKELTTEEKINLIFALLKTNDLIFTNSFKKIIIQFLLFYLYKEKYNILLNENCCEIIKFLIGKEINNNIDELIDNGLLKIFQIIYNIKDFSFVEEFFKKNGAEIELFDKKILEITKNGNNNYYFIIESKQKNDYLSKDLLSRKELILEIIYFNDNKNKNTISLIQENINKEISLKKFIYNLNKCSINIFDYIQLKEKIIIFKENYDLSLNDFLSSKIQLSLQNIRKIFRQLNALLYLFISNNVKSLNIHPKNIIIKYIDKNENKYETKFDSYCFCLPYEKEDIYQLTPEFIKEEKIPKNLEKLELFKIGIIMYCLYIGKHPFGNNLDIILTKIMKNEEKITFDVKLDKDFKDLVTNLLRFDPNKRINWNDYFSHKFFQVKFDDKGNIIV